MLSKELKDLTENGLVSRKELPGNPVSVEYALTDYGRSLDHVIDVMRKWGTEHRRKIMD
jgi:DNA-binding HxlR family transcriptional regulator